MVIGLIVALGIAEFGTRAVGHRFLTPRLPMTYDPGLFDLFGNGQVRLIFDPEIGWSNTPSYQDRAYRNNQAGMRADREYARSPDVGVTRYSAYGDSFTYCSDVQLDACWARQLEQLLPRTEVLNFGTSASAADQAVLLYGRDGQSWHPCAVLIGHMLENINRVVNRYRPFYDQSGMPLAKPQFVLRDGSLTLLPSPARTVEDLKDPVWVEAALGRDDLCYFPGMLLSSPLDVLESVRLVRTAAYRVNKLRHVERPIRTSNLAYPYILPYRSGTEGYDVLLGVLTAFAERVRSNGATPVVLIFPPAEPIVAERDGQPKLHHALLEALRERDVPVVDLTDALGERARSVDLSELVIVHYTRQGNDVVARELARQLPALTRATCPSVVANTS